MAKVKVDNPEAEVHKVVLAQAIVEIGVAMKRLSQSGLNRKAIIILIHDRSKISKRDIEIVFNNLDALAEDYT